MTTTNDLIADGLTIRQIRYWIKAGYLQVASPGSGVARAWPDFEVRVARLMHHLTKAGLSAKAAAEVAREVASQVDRRRIELHEGVWIEVAV